MSNTVRKGFVIISLLGGIILPAAATQKNPSAYMSPIIAYLLSDSSGNTIDSDNDGTPDTIDAFPYDPNETIDTDGDGTGNNADTDDDNDGIPDTSDPEPLVPDISTKFAHSVLLKSTFGPTDTLIQELQTKGVAGWVDDQLNASSAYDSNSDQYLTYLERVIQIARMASPTQWSGSIQDYLTPDNAYVFNSKSFETSVLLFFTSTWFENVLHAEDQLRQRVAYALSQIIVLSTAEQFFYKRAEALAYHYDILAKNAFGNYRDILLEVSKSPGMGLYLTFQGSKKYDPSTQRQPDENYAREIMQLFSIGLAQINLDGSENKDVNGNSIPIYTQTDVEELSRVFTGWDPALNPAYGHTHGSYTQEMEFTSEHHDFEEKIVLGEVIAAGKTGEDDIEAAIDILMNHPNVAPFISKQLIMRLVTSNPSPEYISRVSHVFNDNGEGIKGDLKAVVRAILLDAEAIKTHDESSTFGKAKEPIIAYTQLLRSFEVDYMEPWEGGPVGADSGVNMQDVYLFKSNLIPPFGQGPMRAKSVFNFYSPEYIPNDSYFRTNNIVAPELEIQSAQRITNFNNRLQRDTWSHIRLYYNSPNEYYGSLYDRFIIHYVKERELIENELNSDYKNIRKEPYKTNAINALFNHVNKKLTGSNLSSEQAEIIKRKLSSYTYRDNIYGARDMINRTINAIATTNRYMIQR
ncbi:MAG: DUF1800 family protein [Gammaproteobacteria bacterium]|nr:DUF1800 family protein [Gammaproteobacteria bacterium]